MSQSIRHYLADRHMTKDMYNEHDKSHAAIKRKMERRAELVEGIQNAEQALKKLKNPAFSDQLAISIPSFRFGVSVGFVETELNRQLHEAKMELEEIDLVMKQIGDLLGVEYVQY